MAKKAYFCTYMGLSGALVKHGNDIVFIEGEHGSVVTLHEGDYADLVVLGAVETATEQYIADLLAGGAAGVCTSRSIGRQ
jgi:hypothetical protein